MIAEGFRQSKHIGLVKDLDKLNMIFFNVSYSTLFWKKEARSMKNRDIFLLTRFERLLN